ncbi:MAG: cobalt ECF transporter T component CbiQ, partial [Acidimicrobiia bacterium]|nr:cobalt ECF transporter T component CbiQ [Acidimicrobiia bacterium]
MSGSHVHALTVHGHSPLHRLPARVKLVALGLFVVAVVATPRHQLWAFAVYALLVTMVLVAELPAKF